MTTCSIDGCLKKAEKRGWCGTHYRRWRVNGDANIVKKAPNGSGYIHGGYRGSQKDGVRKFEHVAIAEAAIGRSLPKGAVVHHANCDKLDNRKDNLVVCPDRAYHNLIHARTNALIACGNANWRRCSYCKQYDAPENLTIMTVCTRAYHRRCANEYNRNRLRSNP